MTLRRDPATGVYSADIRDRAMPRLHVSLKTRQKAEAIRRHAAVEALVRSGQGDLVDMLRRREINVEAVARAAQPGHSFDEVRPRAGIPTLGQAVADYLAWLEATGKAANTRRNAAHWLQRAAAALGAARRLDQIPSEEVTALAQSLRGRGLSEPSVGLTLGRLRALYRWVNRQEERAARRAGRAARAIVSPVEAEMVPPPSDARARFLSEGEMGLVLAATPPQMLFPVAAGLLAGLRVGELLYLRPPPHDIDLEHGILTVQEKPGLWRPKTGKRREIPLAAQLRPILERHVATYASAHWMVPSPYVADGARPVDDDTINRAMRRIVEDAGLVYGRRDPLGVTFHTLRHTFASHLVMAGVDLFTVARLLGHSSIAMVESTYGHLAPDHKRLAVGRLDERLGGAFAVLEEGRV